MKNKIPPANLTQVKTFSAHDRVTKVSKSNFTQLVNPNPTLLNFLDSLPDILKASDLRSIVSAILYAYQQRKPVIVGMGGHVIKCGLSPILIHMMEKGIVTAVAMNGGASIHDCEMALIGRTSEDVAASLETGMFGMVQETPQFMNAAIAASAAEGVGMGASLGRRLLAQTPPFIEYSVLAAAARLGVPATVHIGVGQDTIHMHPDADGAAMGETSFLDFRLLVSVLKELGNGGVYLNIGSAVALPEVFLKALNLARNLADENIEEFVTVNMDMLQHYRPLQNVVKRPTQSSGAGYTLTGHHEIMVPLLFNLVLATLIEGEK